MAQEPAYPGEGESMPRNLKVEIQKLVNSQFLKEFTKQLNGYEKKVKGMVSDLDLRSRDARKKSRRQLNVFQKRLKRTRKDVEKTVRSLVNQESKLLNKSLGELKIALKQLSEQEQKAKKTAKRPKRKTAKKRARRTRAGRSRLETIKQLGESRQPTLEPEPVSDADQPPVAP